MGYNAIQDKSYSFALKLLGLHKTLLRQHEYVISRQMIRSGTSVGANVEEALAAQSRRDFHTKLTIAFKEARETHYWLRLLRDSQIVEMNYEELLCDCSELIRILTAITRKTKLPLQPTGKLQIPNY